MERKCVKYVIVKGKEAMPGNWDLLIGSLALFLCTSLVTIIVTERAIASSAAELVLSFD